MDYPANKVSLSQFLKEALLKANYTLNKNCCLNKQLNN